MLLAAGCASSSPNTGLDKGTGSSADSALNFPDSGATDADGAVMPLLDSTDTLPQDALTGLDKPSPAPDLKTTAVYPKDGNWQGKYISFTVSHGGTQVWVHDIDYTSCKVGGCTDSSSLTNCKTCKTGITLIGGLASFDLPKEGCKGTFLSATSAIGTSAEKSDWCKCIISVSWTASYMGP